MFVAHPLSVFLNLFVVPWVPVNPHTTAYVVVKLGDKEVIKTNKDDSHNPEWNYTREVHVKGTFEEFTIAVYEDDDFSTDDFLGSVVIPINRLLGGAINGTFPLQTKEGEPAGSVTAIFSYEAGKVSMFDQLKEKLHGSESESD